jgi:hypothetical protein
MAAGVEPERAVSFGPGWTQEECTRYLLNRAEEILERVQWINGANQWRRDLDYLRRWEIAAPPKARTSEV